MKKIIQKKITNPDEMFAPMDTSGLPLGGRLSEFTETNIEAKHARELSEQAAQTEDPEVREILAFLSEAPEYLPNDKNKEALLGYLQVRRLPKTKRNYLRAWRAMKAEGVALLKSARPTRDDVQTVTPHDIEDLSDSDLAATYQAIRDARIRRKIKIPSAGAPYSRRPL